MFGMILLWAGMGFIVGMVFGVVQFLGVMSAQ